jgi:hypothetical protein
MVVPSFAKKTKKWLYINRERLFLLFGMVCVGILCFEAGELHGALRETDAVSVSLVTPPPPAEAAASPVLIQTAVTNAASMPVPASNCAFVGSRNSDKYHLPKCAAAKRIKPENLVCFASEEDAKKRGYVAGCLK